MSLKPYPSLTRYSLGTLGMGLALGVTWTISMTSPWMQLHLSKPHAYMILYATSGFLMGVQVKLLYKWEKRVRQQRAIMKDVVEIAKPELDALMDKVARQLNERP
jgi:hypothetical protein